MGKVLDLGDALLLKVTEAARRLSIGRTQMYKLINTGEIRAVRIGRSRRIRVSDLEAYVAQLELAA
jgi:excisionase family DNA binding protein